MKKNSSQLPGYPGHDRVSTYITLKYCFCFTRLSKSSAFQKDLHANIYAS